MINCFLPQISFLKKNQSENQISPNGCFNNISTTKIQTFVFSEKILVYIAVMLCSCVCKIYVMTTSCQFLPCKTWATVRKRSCVEPNFFCIHSSKDESHEIIFQHKSPPSQMQSHFTKGVLGGLLLAAAMFMNVMFLIVNYRTN